MHAHCHKHSDNPKEDVEMNSYTSNEKKAITKTFSGLDYGVEYVIKVCTMINGCIISKKFVTLNHEK